jgi:hypothetical protein
MFVKTNILYMTENTDLMLSVQNYLAEGITAKPSVLFPGYLVQGENPITPEETQNMNDVAAIRRQSF